LDREEVLQEDVAVLVVAGLELAHKCTEEHTPLVVVANVVELKEEWMIRKEFEVEILDK
jgi:hypothetical protein